ncbi:MAG: cytochrome ubiquinol oxidase subunit I [Desulfurococcales archaeon]|nr:cytochrome ubiquinol oxidase subunit I [Desulfurococcales archaeon]
MEPGVLWLTVSFGLHIVLVNLGVGISIVAPLLRVIALRRGDTRLDREAYTLTRFYAATYALGGVFGTAFTVYLFSYYPSFTSLLGRIALYNYALAIMALVAHFLSLTLFYYGWSRLSPRIHTLSGVTLAVSALLIVLGFRSVFAQLSSPVGVDLSRGVVTSPFEALLGNPLLPPLYLKSIAAAITATLVAVAGWHALRGEDLARIYLKPALAGLIIVLLAGAWYGLELRRVEYKFNNIFGGLGLGGEPSLDLSWLLILKVVLWGIQVAGVAGALYRGVDWARNLLAAGAISALIAILAGEYLNAYSQYPYFIPPSEAGVVDERLAKVLNLLSPNINTRSELLQLITVASTTILLAAAALYLAITRAGLGAREGSGRRSN